MSMLSCKRFAAAMLLTWIAVPATAADPAKVLRLSQPDLAGLDPHQISDLYSARVVNAIFEGLYQYDYLASPAKVIPNTAAAMPEITDGGRTWTIRLQKGIRFTDDPAFKGGARELVAADYVYSIKRSLDPNLRIGGDPAFTTLAERRAGRRRRREEVGEIRLRRADRRPARARRPYAAAAPDRRRLHGAGPPRLAQQLRRRPRSGRGGRRRHHDEAGRHRPVQTGGLAPRLARRAGREPALPDAGLSRQQRPEARADRAGDEGTEAAGARPHRDLDHRGAGPRAAVPSTRANSTTSCWAVRCSRASSRTAI